MIKKIRTVRIIIATGAILISGIAFAQPANNFCGTAQTLPQDGTCVSGTTQGASDTFPGNIGCQTTNPAEVWYTFTATGTLTNIQLTNITQSGTADIHLIQASGACSGLVLAGASCGASPADVNFTTTIGQLYYVMVSTNGTTGTFEICVDATTPPPTPGQDCTNAAPLCNDASFSQGVFVGVGVVENVATNSCFGANERQSKWYSFTAGTSGTFEFIIDPNNNPDDYDWALWNTTSTCYTSGVTMGAPIVCNWSGCPGNTGVTSQDPCTVINYDCTGNPNDCITGQINTNPPNLVAGQTYSLLIDNFSANGGGFSLDFGGTVEMGPNAEFEVSLGGDCRTVTIDRTPYYTGGNMTYSWNFGDGTTSTSGNPGSYTYAFEGNYFIGLTVTDANGCTDSYSIQIDGCIVLPVELTEFSGYKNEKDNFLYWSTQSESNNDYFTMEHSTDGYYWREIGRVKGAGTTSNKNSYMYSHQNVEAEINYYRLSQTDFDGSIETYDPIAIDNSNNVKLIKVLNSMGQEVNDSYRGIVFEYYSDGSTVKVIR